MTLENKLITTRRELEFSGFRLVYSFITPDKIFYKYYDGRDSIYLQRISNDRLLIIPKEEVLE